MEQGLPTWRKYALSTPPSRSVLWEATFSGFPAGKLVTLPSGLVLTRASAATVQTGTSTVDTTPGVNEARIGRRLDAAALALVIEEARTNIAFGSSSLATAPWAKVFGGETVSNNAAVDPSGASGAARLLTQAIADSGVFDNQNVATGVTYAVSCWAKRNVAADQAIRLRITLEAGVSNQYVNVTAGAAWGRTAGVLTVTLGGVTTADPLVGSSAAAVRDVLLYGVQLEAGTFPTEVIVTTGGNATRVSDQLYLPSALVPTKVVDGGRIGIYQRFRPKCSSANLGTFAGLWSIDGNNQAFVRKSTGMVNVYVAGVAFNSTVAPSWALGDTVETWIEAGGGTLNTRILYRVNGGAVVTLGTSGAPQGTLVNSSSLKIHSTGAGPTGGQTDMSVWLEEVRCFRAGVRPGWAS